MRDTLGAVIGIVLGAVVIPAAVAAWSFIPLHEVRRHALQTLEGVQSRYQVLYFTHEQAPTSCIMLIVDLETRYFTSTVLPASACAPVTP